ncbi:PH domain-containing protein [Halostagnicola sp. GCM10023398]|uniref:PH domain-containing protein n=1 Tax=unclassified Halostagnicola TaxID=2642439 RepID=UPI0036209D98
MNDSQPPAAGRSAEHNSAADRETVRYQTMPTVRPVLIVLGLVLGSGFVTVGLLWVAPELIGGEELATIVMSAVAILVAISTLRLLIKILVLARTQYTIRDDAFHREYDLLYRTQSREIPVRKLRGHEYSQGRIQALLGFGTIRLLTAGTNRSLGFIEFEHLNDPERVRAEIRRVSTETRE